MAITRSQFATQVAHLCGRVCRWAGDYLAQTDRLHEPMRDGVVDMFTAMLRDTADRIDRMHEAEE